MALTQSPVSGYNKFIPYYLAPLVNYSVALIRLERGYKVSVGTNPWSPPARPMDLGKLCKQYGGGGHFSVGGIPFYADQAEHAEEVAQEILELLREKTTTEQDTRKKELLEKSPNFDILDQK